MSSSGVVVEAEAVCCDGIGISCDAGCDVDFEELMVVWHGVWISFSFFTPSSNVSRSMMRYGIMRRSFLVASILDAKSVCVPEMCPS